jgi:hypothetical protein
MAWTISSVSGGFALLQPEGDQGGVFETLAALLAMLEAADAAPPPRAVGQVG